MEQDPTGVSTEKQKKEPPGLWTAADCEKYMMCLKNLKSVLRQKNTGREMEMFVQANDLPS